MDALHREEINGLTVEVEYDPGASANNPREWDNISVIAARGDTRYAIGDEGSGDEKFSPDTFHGNPDLLRRFLGIARNAAVVLPLSLYDHSAVKLYVGNHLLPGETPAPGGGGWDTTYMGYVYVTREKVIEEYGDLSPESLKKAAEVAGNEIETYSDFLNGWVYSWVVTDAAGNTIDSCGGVFDLDYAIEEARECANSHEVERPTLADPEASLTAPAVSNDQPEIGNSRSVSE